MKRLLLVALLLPALAWAQGKQVKKVIEFGKEERLEVVYCTTRDPAVQVASILSRQMNSADERRVYLILREKGLCNRAMVKLRFHRWVEGVGSRYGTQNVYTATIGGSQMFVITDREPRSSVECDAENWRTCT